MNILEDHNKSFLGRGWSFPPAFEENSYAMRMVEEEDDIRESIFILLSTTPGERIMNSGFGCDLHKEVFEAIDSNTIASITGMVSRAIVNYEPRVDLEAVNVDLGRELEGVLEIQIQYTVRSINSRSNIVYPFYFLEGTNLPND